MPNNGIISKQAVIPSSFIVESAESTDLVIINTPLTGSRVEQKAVPVSALGGGSLPYYSAVFRLIYDEGDSTEIIYSDFPEAFDLVTLLQPITPVETEGYGFVIQDNNAALDFRVSYLISELYTGIGNSSAYGELTVVKNGASIAVEHLPSANIEAAGLFIELRLYKYFLI